VIFFSRRKSLSETDLSWLVTDFHSHLLPGIDDGSPDVETSLLLIKGLQSLGYKKLITTPHVLWEMYPNTTDTIESALNKILPVLQKQNPEIELKAAAEYYIDDHFQTELKSKTRLLPISGRKILVEFSMLIPPIELKDVLFELQIQNYEPILAHPERYVYLEKQKVYFDILKDFGCFFQLNLLSLTGHYGPVVQSLAEFLIKKNYYDFIGSDVHHERHIEALKKMGTPAMLKKLKESGKIKNQLL
jgi:tyrosine-protein phosphatase YwqE